MFKPDKCQPIECAPDCDYHEYEPPDSSHEGSEDGDYGGTVAPGTAPRGEQQAGEQEQGDAGAVTRHRRHPRPPRRRI